MTIEDSLQLAAGSFNNNMHDGTFYITGSTRMIFLSAALTMLLLLFVLSARTFMGDYVYGNVPGILDERLSEDNVTMMDLSEETIPAYRDAIKALERAISFDPSRALYRKALSDLYVRLGSWSGTMEAMKAPLPEGAPESEGAFGGAAANIRKAVQLQPTNPDNHLAYGHLSREMKDMDIAHSEYVRAVSAYPGNSSLRYAVTMEYLAAGMNAEALDQAKVLVLIDDSYKMPESYAEKSAIERRTPYYLNRLMGSYLFKAFEIIWRTSNKDVEMLQGIIPDNNEARDAWEVFQESKGRTSDVLY